MTLADFLANTGINPLTGGNYSPLAESVVIHSDDIIKLENKWQLWDLTDYKVSSFIGSTVYLRKTTTTTN
tara:strand:- start:429 stop:638 length:210 start_codon:yes stop_codon:yes gene_type:complete